MPNLLWNGQPIPNTATYPYLGVPTGAAGIDYVTHFSNRTEKAMRHLQILQGRGSHWSADAKAVIVRTFILPSLTYGAGLIGHSPKSIQKQIVSTWQPTHNSFLKWIFNLRSLSCGTKILEAQNNIPSPKRQLIEWAIRLTDHLKVQCHSTL